MLITSTLSTPVVAARRRPLKCEDISNLIFTSLPKPSTDARRVVFMMLKSVQSHFTYDEHDLVPDIMLNELVSYSDLIMALARRLEVDLKNESWTGELAEDVRIMYPRVFNKLVTFLLDTAGGNFKTAVGAVRVSYFANVRYLLNVPDWLVVHNIATTAHKYDVAYVKTTTIEDPNLGSPDGPQGLEASEPPEPVACRGLLAKIKAELKRFQGKEPAEEGVCDAVEQSAATRGSFVSGYESGGDGGVSVCGSDEVFGPWWSDDEEERVVGRGSGAR